MNDEQMIVEEYGRLSKAMVEKDLETIREMMGADTVVRHMTGRTQTMDEWLSEIEHEVMRYYSITTRNPVIRINGSHAELSCMNTIDARIYGMRGTWTLPAGGQFEKRNGTWKMYRR